MSALLFLRGTEITGGVKISIRRIVCHVSGREVEKLVDGSGKR
jgi:hypothetical protein